MDRADVLKYSLEDTRFVLLSKVIDRVLNGEIRRRDLDQHFDQVTWSTHKGAKVSKCTIPHAKLTCIIFKWGAGAEAADAAEAAEAYELH